MRHRKELIGFTFAEVLTVIVIIAVLASILMPVLVTSRAKANTTVCTSNMHQIYLAEKLYADDWNGEYCRDLNAKGFAPYYPTILECPNSKNIQYPKLRVTDYNFIGIPGRSSQVDLSDEAIQRAFADCKESRGPSLPVVLDQNHVSGQIGPSDTSSFLLIREDGSADHVNSWRAYHLSGPCDISKLSYWYNF